MAKSNEFDATKNILNKIRLLTEEKSSNESADNSISITDEPKFGQQTLTQQKDAFKKQLKSNVEFGDNPLVFYPADKDLVFAGTISDLNNLKWQYRLNDPSGDGCYIWVEALQLTEENIGKINKIRNYYLNWKDKLIAEPLF